jgi:serine/threonine-protein kinase/endoribonuclease IRE1
MGILGRLLLRLLLLSRSCGGEEKVPQRCFRPGGQEQEADSRLFRDFADCPAAEGEEPTLLASLLDGSLVALGKTGGVVRWTLDDEPAVKSPYDPLKPVLPAFLPDPKDGALYLMGGSLEDPLQKLPWTIPQLVAASPSRGSDGILYSGKKVDTWVSVSRLTGAKRGSLSFEGCLRGEAEEDMCPVKEPGTVLLGRTEYNIMMYDTRTKDRKWNITYYDYSSSLGGIDMSQDYELAHFTDSSTGRLVTLDRVSGGVLWEAELGSPVVAMYQLAAESIASVPFTSVSQDTLSNLMDQFQDKERRYHQHQQ